MAEVTDRAGDATSEDAIASIAQQMHYPVPTVRRVYEAEFARLKAEARLTDYLALFAARRTRATLRSGRASGTLL